MTACLENYVLVNREMHNVLRLAVQEIVKSLWLVIRLQKAQAAFETSEWLNKQVTFEMSVSGHSSGSLRWHDTWHHFCVQCRQCWSAILSTKQLKRLESDLSCFLASIREVCRGIWPKSNWGLDQVVNKSYHPRNDRLRKARLILGWPQASTVAFRYARMLYRCQSKWRSQVIEYTRS